MERITDETVGGLVREHRRRRGLTLQALADQVGCAKSYLSLIENERREAPPGDELLRRLERALGLDSGRLVRAGRWQATPAAVRLEVSRLEGDRRAGQRLAGILGASGIDSGGKLRGALDEAHKSGELRRLIDSLSPEGAGVAGGDQAGGAGVEGGGGAGRGAVVLDVPLINKVAAGYPTEFTDLAYPARVADEYVRCPGLTDPDAFACRVVGDSMVPEYREGDIVVFSPARPVKSGMDCFARIEPDHQATFKRVYIESGEGGEGELIRLQPLNPAYGARTLAREQIAGLYAAVSVTRTI